MGEIKSTLDLVMQKTRHLSMTPEEKAAQEKASVQKKIKGLVLKYKTSAIRKDVFLDEVRLMRENGDPSMDGEIKKVILEQVTLKGDGAGFLEILTALFDVEVSPLTLIIDDYQSAGKTSRKESAQRILTTLREEKKISGSAVVPNLAADIKWVRAEEALNAKFSGRLERQKRSLMDR
jgi:hypothetical protein